MFQPLSVFVGLRYVRARGKKFFVSFITLVSLLGVCLGVAALIVILSVMNGFEGELRDRLLALTSHARVFAAPNAGSDTPDWAEVAARARAIPGVAGAAPYIELEALAVRTPELLPIRLRGIDPAREAQVTHGIDAVLEGRAERLVAGSGRVIIGSGVAELLAVGEGDTITVLVPAASSDGAPEPRLREFTVAGLFLVGIQDHDSTLVLAALEDVSALVSSDARAIGLHLRFDNALAAPKLAATVAQQLPVGVEVRDWTVDNANYFRAIRIEKTMMAIILMLIVAVAAFNLVAMLVMVVTDKRTDIAILRTFGASPARVMGVFLTQGLAIGWFGVLLGVLLGVWLGANAGAVAAWLQRVFRFEFFSSDVYYITTIPSILDWRQVAWIGSVALVLTLLATVYPALRAARVPPAEALRYE
jgi:lipoprotein-releasing system permease protein